MQKGPGITGALKLEGRPISGLLTLYTFPSLNLAYIHPLRVPTAENAIKPILTIAFIMNSIFIAMTTWVIKANSMETLR